MKICCSLVLYMFTYGFRTRIFFTFWWKILFILLYTFKIFLTIPSDSRNSRMPFFFLFFLRIFPRAMILFTSLQSPLCGAASSSQRASRSNFSKRLLLPMQTIAHLQADVKLTAEVLEKRFIFEQYFTFFDFKQNNWG